jgi:hypothetical protein
MKKTIINILKAILVFTVFFSVVFGIEYYADKQFKKQTYERQFYGHLVTKYSDKDDHNRSKLEILCNSKVIVYDITNDWSGLFEYVNKGDVIEKIPKSFNVNVYNSNKDTTFTLDFGQPIWETVIPDSWVPYFSFDVASQK